MATNKKVRGCLIERNGRYHAVVSYYVEEHRLQDTKSTGILTSAHKKREAEKIMEQLVREKEEELERLAEEKKSHSFADCFERWIDYKSSQIECTTAWSYKNRSKTIIEYFRERDIRIEKLESKDLVNYYDWALANGRRNVYNENTPSGLSRRTVRDQASLIKEFLNDAVVQKIIAINPADKVKVAKTKENNTEEVAYMNLEQAKAFLNYVRTVPIFEKLYHISKVGLYYGCRRSEILGLKWSAIDFEKGEIVINHTIVRAEQGDVCRDNVKTKSSHRYYPLLDDIRDDLMEIMESQKKLGIYSKDGYVFKWEDGRVYSPDYITKLFRKAVIRSGCVPEDLTVHGLRHSCCAILFENGWELGQVQNWLGHSDITVTANIYNHVSKKWKNKHGEKVDRVFA
ncbi:MAG: site-specific integrase [Acetatifactor muris]|nr:site-specific integrase [Acetatifactor muris]MCM1525721.1 site-specific integrase [Bacteroides sp.]